MRNQSHMNIEEYSGESLSSKPRYLYYQTSENILEITQSFSSQAIQLSVQSLNVAHRQNRQHLCLPSFLQASYFFVQFLLGSNAPTCVNSHITHSSKLRNNCAILKEWIPSACNRNPHGNIPATDNTLSLPLISTGSLTEMTCMSYLWENTQLSEVQ